MSWFGVTPLKKFPAPVLRPMAPFLAAADEFKNDPQEPQREGCALGGGYEW
ncbi:predicted protein [Chaetomium globosum CBS 148.51]|uniref:Uncharacterized protein n=1 Tax=Chaetomium globosum (strain ATCC 6205 / CBS 148.51 / DSM 1962 / NBRC 6347 / NRRL 1970) TaxID=306901 RepID=Q2H3L1_CHAGB|nr:uncharacterized protein CHGG_06754 [Chaetomium globosum CBS 148.51]EAQ90135.1 predicted protein [Chaetomium globosum CBS 148.51]